MIPVHVHTTVPLAVPCEQALQRLADDPSGLATDATAAALEAVAPLARAGGFRATALPGVTGHAAAEEDLAAAVVSWSGDEEATGWPSMQLRLVVTPTRSGTSRLAVLSARGPGYDLSTNRIDKVWRDRLARTAVHAFASALARAVTAVADRPTLTAPRGANP